jgi:hypothetical protein
MTKTSFSFRSACTVATQELFSEVAIAIISLTILYPKLPIIIIVPLGQARLLDASIRKNRNVKIIERDFSPSPEYKKHNNYHQISPILMKMEAMKVGIDTYGDCLFFDADLTFFEKIDGPEDCELALSLNLPQENQDGNGMKYGFYNAGLIWSNNPTFPNWWKEKTLESKGFYEQGCLNMTGSTFRCGFFDLKHNHGFWRGSIGGRTVKSLHLHLSKALDVGMPKNMVNKVREVRKEAWQSLFPNTDPRLVSESRRLLGLPQKLWFVHYGKAAGIYTNKILKNQVLKKYEIFDSWDKKLGRDWTKAELQEIILTAKGPTFLHQHHINISKEEMSLAKKNGWTTFSFLRNPADILCSLYHWNNDRAASGLAKSEGLNALTSLPFRDYWMEMLKPANLHLWTVPDYYDDIDYVCEFSEDALAGLIYHLFGFVHTKSEPKNVSSSKGLQGMIASDEIDEEMLAAIYGHSEYERFLAFRSRNVFTF